MSFYSRASWILLPIQNALLDQPLGRRSTLNLVLQVIHQHVLLELVGLGLEGRRGVDTAAENVTWIQSDG
jgi:hypothetical protein